jgi:glycosyltransferase involved in cell wall biosynthesis
LQSLKQTGHLNFSKVNKMRFSVLLSLYAKELPAKFQQCLDSILVHQSILPQELVLVLDGPLSEELTLLVQQYQLRFPLIKTVPLPTNQGLGKALKIGMEHCNCEWIARMDTDDIAHPHRFEKQINYLKKNTELMAIGSFMAEFTENATDVVAIKKVPVSPQEIKNYASYRNPINHPTVFFNKKAVLSVGSYEDIPLFEDFYLWHKMIHQQYQLGNVPEVLLYFRIGNNALSRRHGWQYLRKEVYFFNKLYRKSYISLRAFLLIFLFRTPMRLLPLGVLKKVYQVFLR